MSLEHHPARDTPESASDLPLAARAPPTDPDYWHSLIDEKAAAAFLDLSPRTMQALRQKGDGPPYIVISSRCLRYRRIGLKQWAESRIRTSTSEVAA